MTRKMHLLLSVCSLLIFSFVCPALSGVENRIVSLVPSQTELLYAMGFSESIVAVSDYCNYPEEARQKATIGSLELNIEKIVSLRPTILVDVNSMHKKYEPLFGQLGLNYVNMTATRLEHLPVAAVKLAGLLGEPQKGNEFVDHWNATILKLQIEKPKVPVKAYFEIWDTPAQAAGGSSFIGELIVQAGGVNILEGDGDFPVVNPETVIKQDPDVILVSYPLPDLSKIKTRPGWHVIKAVKNSQLFALDQDIFVRPGPRNLEAIEQLNKIFRQVHKQ